jgi:hypothetical protein
MRSSLNLAGDGDDLDVVADVERTFGIKLSNQEAEKTFTVGQLRDLIESKQPDRKTQACLSQAAFYRLRNALKEMGWQTPVNPATPIGILNELGPEPIRRKWKLLGCGANLDLPPLESPVWIEWPERVERIINLLLFCLLMATTTYIGFLAASLAASATHGWSFFLVIPVAIGLGTAIVYAWRWIFGNIPRRIITLGDLAREAAGYSFQKLSAEKNGSSPDDRWFALTAILRGISGHKPPIIRATTFFSKQAKPNA